MVLEGVMIIIACTCLTLLHPAVCFQGVWHEANFVFRTSKHRHSGSKDRMIADEETGGNLNVRGIEMRGFRPVKTNNSQ